MAPINRTTPMLPRSHSNNGVVSCCLRVFDVFGDTFEPIERAERTPHRQPREIPAR